VSKETFAMPTTSRRPRLGRLAAASVALLLLAAATVACRVPQRYDVTTHQADLNHPWEVAFLPDGTMFVTERPGDIGVRRTNGQFTRLSPRAPGVVESGEGGMMGLAVDPNFGSNRRIYACYLTANDVRVVRFNVSADLTRLNHERDLVVGIQRTSGRHSGCRLAFKPGTGELWVTTGDAASCLNPQDLGRLAGKVLRVDIDGNAIEGNMRVDDQLTKIYAYGFRNPQGISFRRSDGAAFITEHGPDRDDEITRLQLGGNGGWAPRCNYDESVPMTNFNLGNVLPPTWQSGSSTIAPSGATFVYDADWGDRAGQLAVAVLKGQQLRMFNVQDGSADGGGAVLTGYGRLRTAVEGPDGRLYIATDANPGRILAVQPVL
jgi:glucose/arabinose dehydrogenase